jgi:hypothetical protein
MILAHPEVEEESEETETFKRSGEKRVPLLM